MARKKKVYDDDDGRTIADMSGVAPQPLLIPRLPHAERKERVQKREAQGGEEDQPWEAEQNAMSKEERRWYVLGALKAALLIALAFIAAFGLLIVLLILAWR